MRNIVATFTVKFNSQKISLRGIEGKLVENFGNGGYWSIEKDKSYKVKGECRFNLTCPCAAKKARKDD